MRGSNNYLLKTLNYRFHVSLRPRAMGVNTQPLKEAGDIFLPRYKLMGFPACLAKTKQIH